jgi:hypothetical protein
VPIGSVVDWNWTAPPNSFPTVTTATWFTSPFCVSMTTRISPVAGRVTASALNVAMPQISSAEAIVIDTDAPGTSTNVALVVVWLVTAT